MSKIAISYPETGLNVSISILNATTLVEDFSGIMTEKGSTKCYLYEFSEVAGVDYIYTITTTGYDDITGVLYADPNYGLTDVQANHLMKLRNGGGGGAIIDGKSIEEFVKKGNAPLIRTIEKLPEDIKEKIDEKISEENTLAEEKINHIMESKDQEIEKALGVVDVITKKTEGTIEEMKTIAIQMKQNSEKFVYSLELKQEAKEKKELEERISKETAELNEKIRQQADSEAKAITDKIETAIKEESVQLNEKIKEEANRKANELEKLQHEKQKELDEIQRKKDEIKNTIS